MSSEERSDRPLGLDRVWELWAAFGFGLAMLVLPDLLGFYESAQSGQGVRAIELLGTALDAGIFLVVMSLLRRAFQRRRQAEAALKRSNEELRQASHFKTELLGIAAHDLKNPLASLRALARLLMETPGGTKPVVETAQYIETVTEEMLGLVHELLETAALEGAQLKLARALLDLQEIVAEAVMEAEPAAGRKGQRIVLEAGEPLVVEADAGRMRQVLANLLSNAIKFSPPERCITVRTRGAGETAEVTVADEGPGMSREDRGRAFERFQRLSARPTGGESSTGLGLWIVKEIVSLHGGRVWITSAGLGQGTQFHVALPAVETPGKANRAATQ